MPHMTGIQCKFSSKHKNAVGRIMKLLGSFTSNNRTMVSLEGKALLTQPKDQCDRAILF